MNLSKLVVQYFNFYKLSNWHALCFLIMGYCANFQVATCTHSHNWFDGNFGRDTVISHPKDYFHDKNGTCLIMICMPKCFEIAEISTDKTPHKVSKQDGATKLPPEKNEESANKVTREISKQSSAKTPALEKKKTSSKKPKSKSTNRKKDYKGLSIKCVPTFLG